MENTPLVLKAIADHTRLKIVKLLLKHNYCVGALARRLQLTEAAVSQHLKVLREAGLLIGQKRGYFMHYDVDRDRLRMLAAELEEMAAIQRQDCKPDEEACIQKKQKKCHVHKSGERYSEEKEIGKHDDCKCHES
ncbi:MAG: metalloregulator ArsR/SmtB family transcription factor [Thermotaleaceae bacterium]